MHRFANGQKSPQSLILNRYFSPLKQICIMYVLIKQLNNRGIKIFFLCPKNGGFYNYNESIHLLRL